uniref:ADP-ribose pyrophosphatase YjhB, NUDIX family n=1 Tax=Candidatus Kentrum sp. FM TaxID=2126340 RepID=A0A450W2Y6_9GAMM|nr:MAG: ADP-ribose pyrophosphatase YjhB, NUDIX family [Candidatus Kentron sp. FM]VFJ63935.1 MAG: ADP-ribose pyrophosphatase YjhB, NUDIX family [Candidatus Kentron sp. FM]VFK11362.1 MAG: ADP-ribose pyrophosphatase YjhB, NUDIX family [Candidatus Kentron sp. FM]
MSALVKQLSLWADRLRNLSARGLCYSRNSHDRENYHAIQAIAREMFALETGQSVERMGELHAPLFSRPTPLSCGAGAVIDDKGNILLMKRPDSGLWILPGGLLEVGETPAEGVAREVLEETGVHCEIITLVGLFNVDFDVACFPHQIYLFTFLCKRSAPAIPDVPLLHPDEVADVGWFAENALPGNLYPRTMLHVTEAFRVWRGDNRAFFDGLPAP